MAKKSINHKERKRQIRAVSLRLFARYGFNDVNFGMIAKECGVARTLLYTYFKDKRAIFNEAVNEATSSVEAQYREIMHSRQSADAKLRQLCIAVFALLFDNRDFLCVIVDTAIDPNRATSLIYSQFEVVVLRLAVSGDASLSDSIDKMHSILLAFRSNEGVLRRFQ